MLGRPNGWLLVRRSQQRRLRDALRMASRRRAGGAVSPSDTAGERRYGFVGQPGRQADQLRRQLTTQPRGRARPTVDVSAAIRVSELVVALELGDLEQHVGMHETTSGVSGEVGPAPYREASRDDE
jgi:hypothetical protein